MTFIYIYIYMCVCVCVCVLLENKRLDRSYQYSIFKCLSIIGRRVVTADILSPNISIYQMGPKIRSCYFIQKVSNDFDKILVIYGDCLPK
jgi:hypothetical protein